MMAPERAEVALVTCQQLPEPDPDAQPLEAALEAAGLTACHLAWDNPSPRWSSLSMCVLRSTWNYTAHLGRFLEWGEHVSRESVLWNPMKVVRWNVHKRYLADLSRRGVATVPTVYISRGDVGTRLADIMDARGWRRAVIKPEVSAASANTHVIDRDDVSEVQETLFSELVSEREMMVQPYIESVEGHGERAVVWIDGEITHAVRKSPRFEDEEELVSDAVPVEDDERTLALAALRCAEGPLLYGRVDMVRDDAGVPMVMELELVEPSLFLVHSQRALERFVDAICADITRNRS